MKYKHRWISGDPINLPVGKVVCVGRNYAAHIAELGNVTPEAPVLFIKPTTALMPMELPIPLPANRGEVHHEAEIALLINSKLSNASESECAAAVLAIGIGLDLTLRDLQSQQKNKGLPWEIAKAFDNSCPLSGFVAKKHVGAFDDIEFSLSINGELKQQGHSSNMLTPIPKLLSTISQHFTLVPGDIVLTGTPEGVGPLQPKDRLELQFNDSFVIKTTCT
ncbi:isomerase/hydrolase [Endozoicomonas sp. (ex Bugula neritina AB1)]|nr:isomerase/hydrolase [Endozoicomonas sp. (ex Bugula neritina AB1)]